MITQEKQEVLDLDQVYHQACTEVLILFFSNFVCCREDTCMNIIEYNTFQTTVCLCVVYNNSSSIFISYIYAIFKVVWGSYQCICSISSI